MRTRRPHHPQRHPPSLLTTSTLLLLLLLSSTPTTASTYDCSNIRLEKHSYDLSALSGPHNITHVAPHPPNTMNTTVTLDLCQPLRRHKDVPKEHQCPGGSRVCMVQTLIEEDGTAALDSVIPVAGDFVHHGKALDAVWEVWRKSGKEKEKGGDGKDGEEEGLRVTLRGGQYPFGEQSGRKQMAVVEFVCDKLRTGLEGLVDGEEKEKMEGVRVLEEEKNSGDDDDEPDHDEDGKDRKGDDDKTSLRFISYGPSTSKNEAPTDTDVLRLQWRTKHACKASEQDDKPDHASNHWGFFTWMVIIWDLLPHSDTIRDIPYLMKDFTRRVVNTVSSGGGGGGSRGGYSAV
ncbi:MAG: hypothetical protein M1816_005952 [Peltula sp. TS41687]|nr:MAG: hypothetical protein M1816_005952 [Peltula sp. TS41687]